MFADIWFEVVILPESVFGEMAGKQRYYMDTVKQQQIEALKMAAEYLDRLIPSMEAIIGEIKGQMQDDTVDFLIQIIDGLNFMIETYNATKDIINGDDPLINEDVFEDVIGKLSDGFAKKDYISIADNLEESIVPFLKVFKEAAIRA